jgi:peptidoglycan L-alanyl-D-glutamate endopeptidase CwlK
MEIIDSATLYKDQRFFLNDESWDRLETLDSRLAVIVQHAIGMSDIEFQVLEGRRTRSEHDFLYSKGATQDGVYSAHFYGMAVDLIAYLGDRPIIEVEPYRDIAQCMQYAAEHVGVPIQWGGCPQVDDLRGNREFYEDLTNNFFDICRGADVPKTPTINPHHFEIPVE